MRYTNINLCLFICFLGSDFLEFLLNLHTHGTDLRLFIAHHKLVHTPLHFIAMQLPGDQYQHAPWYHPPAVMTFLKELQFWRHNKTSKPVWKEASDRVSYTDCKTIHGRRTMVVFQPSLSVFLGVCFVSFLFFEIFKCSTRTNDLISYEFLLCSHPLKVTFFINSFIVFVICKCFTDSVQCRHKSVYDERETWNDTFAAGGKEACSVSAVTTKPFAPLL